MKRSPESRESREAALVEEIAKEAIWWVEEAPKRERLEGNYGIYRALDNAYVKELSERKRLIPLIKKEIWRINKVKMELEEQRREFDEAVAEDKRARMMEEAAEAEKLHPPGAYGADLLEEDDEDEGGELHSKKIAAK